ncbi:MAG TPA: hypothetical protein VFG00_05760 [Acidothermaceae bacterium]|nr:hypothetical protein [Acidothermaceae bacterium]
MFFIAGAWLTLDNATVLQAALGQLYKACAPSPTVAAAANPTATAPIATAKGGTAPSTALATAVPTASAPAPALSTAATTAATNTRRADCDFNTEAIGYRRPGGARRDAERDPHLHPDPAPTHPLASLPACLGLAATFVIGTLVSVTVAMAVENVTATRSWRQSGLGRGPTHPRGPSAVGTTSPASGPSWDLSGANPQLGGGLADKAWSIPCL